MHKAMRVRRIKIPNRVLSIRRYGTFTPINNYGKGPGISTQQAVKYHESLLRNYIHSILDPEYAVDTGSQVRQAGIVPIPTASISFKNEFNITPDSNGEFYLTWSPNFFSNLEGLSQYKAGSQQYPCNYLSHILIKNGNYIKNCPSYIPNVDISKYRLVSAKIKISYVGPLLNVSGKMYGCATYTNIPVTYGWTDHDGADNITDYAGLPVDWSSNPDFAKFFDLMSVQKIRNGLWPKNIILNNDVAGLEAVFLPSDPTDHTFFPMMNYYSTQAIDLGTSTAITGSSNRIIVALNSNDGAHLNFAFCGTGLAQQPNSIAIQTFYNFELIPTAESAPFLRTNNEVSKEVNLAAYSVIQGAPLNESVIMPVNPNNSMGRNGGGLAKSLFQLAGNAIKQKAKSLLSNSFQALRNGLTDSFLRYVPDIANSFMY